MYVIAHDDYAFSSELPTLIQARANKAFAFTYQFAAARFCISQTMAEVYAERYGVPAHVIYPTRDPANPAYSGAAQQTGLVKDSLRFAYFGSIYTEDVAQQIYNFSLEAARGNHRVVVYSPQRAVLEKIMHIRGYNKHLELADALPSATLLSKLRDEADALLLPISFSAKERSLVRTQFPTKMADYSALGIPVIVWAPRDASITRFVIDHQDSAELVTDENPAALLPAITRLACSPARRQILGQNLLRAGHECFSAEAAWKVFSDELIRHHGVDNNSRALLDA